MLHSSQAQCGRAGSVMSNSFMTETIEADTLAIMLCTMENRSKGRSFDEVVAPGARLWMRHRHEAEQLISELYELGYYITPRPEAVE